MRKIVPLPRPSVSTLVRTTLAMSLAATTSMAAIAQESAPDPLDTLCAQLGTPMTQADMRSLPGMIAHNIDSNYSEVIGAFEKGRARTVRYFDDKDPTAHYAYLDERKLCLTKADGEGVSCGVPVACLSAEADFVLTDQADLPFVRLGNAAPADQELPNTSDWVTFAGGTTNILIPRAQLPASRARSALNARFNNTCPILGDHSTLDSAVAYQWLSQCTGAQSNGNGTVAVLDTNGQLSSLAFGPGKGLEPVNGRLHWSFGKSPMTATVTCKTKDDTAIPKSADEVAEIDVKVALPPIVEIGDPVIYEKILSNLLPDVQSICGVAPERAVTEIQFVGNNSVAATLMTLSAQRNRFAPKGNSHTAQRSALQRTQSLRANALNQFAAFFRRKIDGDRTADIMASLRTGRELLNIADGMRETDVRTLVAMTKGIVTWMPWAGQSPTYSNGEFRLTWRLSSQDPSLAFFNSRRQHPGWAEIERIFPASPKAQYVLNLSCTISAAEAAKLDAKRWVFVEATMLSFAQNTMALRCRSQ